MKFAIGSLLFIAVAVGVHSAPQVDIITGVGANLGVPVDQAIGGGLGGNGGIQVNTNAEANVDAGIDLSGTVGGAVDLSGNVVSQIDDILGEVLGANGSGSVTAIIQLLIKAAVEGTPINAVLGSLGKILSNVNLANLRELTEKQIQQLVDKIASAGILPHGLIRAILQLVNTIIRGLKAGQAVPEILRAALGILNGLKGLLGNSKIGTVVGNISGNGALNLNGILANIKRILLSILSPNVVDRIMELINALKSGNPERISAAIESLLNAIKRILSGHLAQGALNAVNAIAGLLLSGNPNVSKEQIIKALNQLQPELSKILKPKLVKFLMDLLKKLCLGLVSNVLSFVKNTLGGLLSGNGIGGIGGIVSIKGKGKALLNLNDALEQIRKILKLLVSSKLADILVDLIKALLTGNLKAAGLIVRRLVNLLKTLVNKNGLVPGALRLVKGIGGQLLGGNPKLSKHQIMRALKQLEVILLHFANPKLVKTIIGVIYKILCGGPLKGLLSGLGGLLGGVLGPHGVVGGVLHGLGVDGAKGAKGGFVNVKHGGGLLGVVGDLIDGVSDALDGLVPSVGDVLGGVTNTVANTVNTVTGASSIVNNAGNLVGSLPVGVTGGANAGVGGGLDLSDVTGAVDNAGGIINDATGALGGINGNIGADTGVSFNPTGIIDQIPIDVNAGANAGANIGY